jgi:molybdopterin-guanine dinucleotide biosynthesis protein A
MNYNDQLTLIIQAGGKSLRMGYDKALKNFLGEPLVQRLVRRFQPLGQEIAIIARRPLDYAFLNLPIYTDVQPDVGALGGLLTAMTVAHTPFAAVIACDMPFANAEMLLDEWRLIRENDFDVVIPDHDKRLQPFHAVYRVETCLPSIYKAIEKGERKVISWLDDVNVCKIPTVNIRKFDPLCMAFVNLNTPDDFKSAEKIARYYKR